MQTLHHTPSSSCHPAVHAYVSDLMGLGLSVFEEELFDFLMEKIESLLHMYTQDKESFYDIFLLLPKDFSLLFLRTLLNFLSPFISLYTQQQREAVTKVEEHASLLSEKVLANLTTPFLIFILTDAYILHTCSLCTLAGPEESEERKVIMENLLCLVSYELSRERGLPPTIIETLHQLFQEHKPFLFSCILGVGRNDTYRRRLLQSSLNPLSSLSSSSSSSSSSKSLYVSSVAQLMRYSLSLPPEQLIQINPALPGTILNNVLDYEMKELYSSLGTFALASYRLLPPPYKRMFPISILLDTYFAHPIFLKIASSLQERVPQSATVLHLSGVAHAHGETMGETKSSYYQSLKPQSLSQLKSPCVPSRIMLRGDGLAGAREEENGRGTVHRRDAVSPEKLLKTLAGVHRNGPISPFSCEERGFSEQDTPSFARSVDSQRGGLSREEKSPYSFMGCYKGKEESSAYGNSHRSLALSGSSGRESYGFGEGERDTERYYEKAFQEKQSRRENDEILRRRYGEEEAVDRKKPQGSLPVLHSFATINPNFLIQKADSLVTFTGPCQDDVVVEDCKTESSGIVESMREHSEIKKETGEVKKAYCRSESSLPSQISSNSSVEDNKSHSLFTTSLKQSSGEEASCEHQVGAASSCTSTETIQEESSAREAISLQKKEIGVIGRKAPSAVEESVTDKQVERREVGRFTKKDGLLIEKDINRIASMTTRRETTESSSSSNREKRAISASSRLSSTLLHKGKGTKKMTYLKRFPSLNSRGRDSAGAHTALRTSSRNDKPNTIVEKESTKSYIETRRMENKEPEESFLAPKIIFSCENGTPVQRRKEKTRESFSPLMREDTTIQREPDNHAKASQYLSTPSGNRPLPKARVEDYKTPNTKILSASPGGSQLCVPSNNKAKLHLPSYTIPLSENDLGRVVRRFFRVVSLPGENEILASEKFSLPLLQYREDLQFVFFLEKTEDNKVGAYLHVTTSAATDREMMGSLPRDFEVECQVLITLDIAASMISKEDRLPVENGEEIQQIVKGTTRRRDGQEWTVVRLTGSETKISNGKSKGWRKFASFDKVMYALEHAAGAGVEFTLAMENVRVTAMGKHLHTL